MEVNQTQPGTVKQPKEVIAIIYSLLSILISRFFNLFKGVFLFAKRVNEQSEVIETFKTQNIEIENLKQKVSTLEEETLSIENLKQKILVLEEETFNIQTLKQELFECKWKIVLLQKGRRFVSSSTF